MFNADNILVLVQVIVLVHVTNQQMPCSKTIKRREGTVPPDRAALGYANNYYKGETLTVWRPDFI